MSVLKIIRPLLMIGCALPLMLLALSGCPGPGDPVANCATCADCNPKTAFPGAKVPLPNDTPFELFKGGAPLYGCIGVTWPGQTDDPPAFVAELAADGSYKVFDTKIRDFSSDPVLATVAPGVGEIDVLFFVLRTAKDAAIKLECANMVKGGVNGCFGSADCLFAWKVEKTNAVGAGGTCKLCRREICDNKDNDCDGQVDNGGACGKILKDINCDAHSEATVAPDTPGCNPTGACTCKVTSTDKIYVCAGDEGKAKWTPLDDVKKLCTAQTVNNSVTQYCGGVALLCDTCDGHHFRFRDAGDCASGILKRAQ